MTSPQLFVIWVLSVMMLAVMFRISDIRVEMNTLDARMVKCEAVLKVTP